MPRLIVLNGPPGVGKSTLAQRYVEDRPLALNLDVDRLRGMLGDWLSHPTAAGLRARALALDLARASLTAGSDVVVPQYLARPAFLDQLAALAADADVPFHELALCCSPAQALHRCANRAVAAEHAELAAQLAGHDGPTVIATMTDRLDRFLATRPQTQRLDASGGVEVTYRRLLSVVD